MSPSSKFIINSTSVHEKGKLPPFGGQFVFFTYTYYFFKKYLLDELLPFSLYRGSLVNSPHRTKSAMPLFTVLLDIEVFFAMVFIDAKSFRYSVNSNFKRILLYIRFIRQYDEEISAFQSPKQLFAYFGLDPAVKQSGSFEGNKISMSKRGSRIARRVLHTMALISISRNKDETAKNPVLHDYYLKKCQSKPKMVALGAIMHKVCNIVFAILRDEMKFEIITQRNIKRIT